MTTEKATPVESQATDFGVYAEGMIYASVCSSLPQEEVERRMSLRLCGTTNGWVFCKEAFRDGTPNPSPCSFSPQTHKHYLFNC